MVNNDIRKILKFIDENFFKSDNSVTCLCNYMKLEKFLNENGIILDYNTSFEIARNSLEVRKMINVLSETVIPSDNISSLFNVKVAVNAIKSNKIDPMFEYYLDVPALTKNDEVKYISEAKNGNLESRNKVIESNMKYVIRIVLRNLGKGLSFNELISEGYMALNETIDKCDVNGKTRFYFSLYSIVGNRIDKAIELHNQPLEAPIDDVSYVSDVDKYLDFEFFMKDFENSYLNEQEKDVLKLRYGITTGSPLTLEEVGKMTGVTRERIRQVENRALMKCRKSSLLRKHNM